MNEVDICMVAFLVIPILVAIAAALVEETLP